METIIHIGQHKTGTTSLQKFLHQHTAKLKAQGFYYTDTVLDYIHTSHYVLNLYALKPDRYSSMKDKVVQTRGEEHLHQLQEDLPSAIKQIYAEAARSGCDKVIWSNEGLYLLNTVEEYQKLFQLFAPFSSSITAVCCFRNKESYSISYAKQLRKQGISQVDQPDSYRYVKPDSWLFDYDRKKTLLAQVFDRTLYWDYDKEDNISCFLNLFGIEIDAPTRVRLNITGRKKRGLLTRAITKLKRLTRGSRN